MANTKITLGNIADDAVGLDQLNISNDPSDGQALTYDGNSTNLQWATISGTTINNNADNRVITGSGTANTLNGESSFTFDGTKVGIGTSSGAGKLTNYTSANRQQSFQGANGDLDIISDNNSAPVVYIKGTGTADLLNVFDNTTEVFSIQDGGQVLIGQDSGDAFNDDSMLRIQRTGDRVFQQFKCDADQNVQILFGDVDDDVECSIQYHPSDQDLRFTTGNNAEAMRILSNQRINIGAVAHSADINQAILNAFINSSTIPVCRFAQGSTTTTVPVIRCRHENSSNGFYIDFRTDENAVTGTIKDVSGTMTYASASDSRLKNNVETIPEGLTEVLAMNPVKFTWDEKKGGNESRGFLAQELNNQYPWAVQSGGDDPHTDPWQADYGKLTPVLVKAVQELKAELDAAKARIETLESN